MQCWLFRVIAVVRPERFELPTAWFVARYSIQLSYGRPCEERDYWGSEGFRQHLGINFFIFGSKLACLASRTR